MTGRAAAVSAASVPAVLAALPASSDLKDGGFMKRITAIKRTGQNSRTALH